MKKIFFLFIALCPTLATQPGYAINKKPIFSPPIKREIIKKPLMVSHLHSPLIEHLNLTSDLSYARGHEFYDTPVVLLDENGKQITFKHDLDKKKKYTLHTLGQTSAVESNIWFFSPNGTDQEFKDKNDIDICTAEKPCKNITQTIADGIHSRAPNANLWFESGSYSLPIVQQNEKNPKLIELNNNQIVVGRTPRFRHIAYGHQRPLFLGTLAWNDYSRHDGSWGTVENIVVRTLNNKVQFNNEFFNTNLYSTGYVGVENSSLEIADGINIVAVGSFVLNSNLSALDSDSNDASHHIFSSNIRGETIGISNSNLKSNRVSIFNESPNLQGSVWIGDSNITVEGKTDNDAIAIISYGNVSIDFSNITVKNQGENHQAYGVLQNTFVSNEAPLSLYLTSSHINIFAEDEMAIAISGDWETRLSDSTIEVQSMSSAAMGIDVGPFSQRTIKFFNKPSFIKLSSPIWTEFFLQGTSILNNTTPLSQCQRNIEVAKECA